MLDTILENTKWRYRGLWYLNKENESRDPSVLSEQDRFRTVNLPHGPLLDIALLDQVVEKMKDTFISRKQSGKDGYIYLLSHILMHEDGTRFHGQNGTGRKEVHRYYYNPKQKIRIRCDELDPFIMNEVRERFSNVAQFDEMVEAAIRRRQAQLPKIESDIREAEREIEDLEV
jgi:hypothetical protein